MASTHSTIHQQVHPEGHSDSVAVMNRPALPVIGEGEGQMVAGISTSNPVRVDVVDQETGHQTPSTTDQRGDGRIGVSIEPPPPQFPGSPKPELQDFRGNSDTLPIPKPRTWIEYDIPRLLRENPQKSGIAFLTVCTGDPGMKGYIHNCTAMDKMNHCFDRLGYITVVVGENIKTAHITSLVEQVKTLVLPDNICRVFFWYFGHGTEESLDLADGDFDRSSIISGFQSICPPEKDVFKIFMFDTCSILEEDMPHSTANSTEHWIPGGKYPDSTNTLVINSTEMNCEALYSVADGCGLLTFYFALFAPTTNDSIRELLVKTRCKIRDVLKKKYRFQMLVYEDILMGTCNLLAESNGEARVVPTIVDPSVAVLSTNVHLKFDPAMESKVSEFKVEVFPDSSPREVISTHIRRCERVATIKKLEPDTTYTARAVVKYNDNKEVKSDAYPFKTPARACPSDTKVVPRYPGSPAVGVTWKYSGAITDLEGFHVEAETDEEKLPPVNAPANVTGCMVKGFMPEKKYIVKVLAVYRDERTTKHSIEYDHASRTAPDDIKVTQAVPGSKNAVVHWSFRPRIGELKQFRVEVVNESDQQVLKKDVPYSSREYTIEGCLQPSVKYRVTVIAEFSDSIGTSGTTHHINCARPTFKVPIEEQYSATIEITEPPTQQDLQEQPLKLTSIMYMVCELSAQDGDEDEKSKKGGFVDFKPPYKSDGTSEGQTHQREIPNLKPSKAYTLKMRVEYGEGNYVYSDSIPFRTLPYTVPQKMGYCCGYIGIFSFLLFVMLSALFLCALLPVYFTVLRHHTVCSTEYILTADSVKCGRANSLQFGTMQVGGDQRDGDTLVGLIQAWSVKESDLIFYSQWTPPITALKVNVSENQLIFLQGWQTFTWTGSIIYGYCCITNHRSSDVTSNLYIFTTETDAVNFENGKGAQNFVLSDSITIPSGKTQCFRSWGAGRPFTVSRSSYHYIAVDMPGNTTFSSNITVFQRYVNVSDYGGPHFFQYDNTTTFSLSKELFSKDEYVAICKAPFFQFSDQTLVRNESLHEAELNSTENSSLSSSIGSESLHISSCNKPHYWMQVTFPTLFGVGFVFFIGFVALCACLCYRMCKHHRNRLFISCFDRFRSPRTRGYSSI